MTILTATQLREHLETDLGDTALTRLADAAEAVILGAVGPVSSQVDFLEGGERELFLTRAVSSITAITERDDPDDDETTLAADDYRLEGKFSLLRLREGTNPRTFWAPRVKVTYTPDISTGLLADVQVKLVKIAVGFSGFRRESDGDFDFWHEDTEKEVRTVLAPLTRAGLTLGLR